MRRRAALGAFASLAALAAPSVASALSQQGHEYGSSFAAPSLLEPAGVAVNESTGDVYVADHGHNQVKQFSATGAFVSKLSFEAPTFVAIDNSTEATDPSSGDVYVASTKGKPTVEKFDAEGKNLGPVFAKSEKLGHIDGISVDTHGVLWIAWSEGRITHYSDALKNEKLPEPEAGETEYEPSEPVFLRPGFAVNANDQLYLDVEPFGLESKRACKAAPCVVVKLVQNEGTYAPEVGESFDEGVFGSNETGIAVDLTNDHVYVAHSGFVAAYDENQGRIQDFGEGHLTEVGGIAVDGKTQDVYVSDAATGELQVYVPAAHQSAPTIDAASTRAIGTTAATASAKIDPSGLETSVSFEYGAGSCASGGCTKLPAEAIPAGHGDVERSVALAGLLPGTSYALRVTASNSAGEATSRETSFTTRALPLPDGRAWELVSSLAAGGANYESAPLEGGLIEASEDGTALSYISTAPTEKDAQGNRSPAFSQNIARRSTSAESGTPGWSSQDITIPAAEQTAGVVPGALQEYKYFTPDLGTALIQPYGLHPKAEPPLSAPAKEGEEQEKTLYRRSDVEGTCLPLPSHCYEALVTAANNHGELNGTPTHFGGGPTEESVLRFEGTSPDAQNVVFSSPVPLTAGAAPGRNLYEWRKQEPESLKLVNLLPVLVSGEHPRLAETSLFFGQQGHVIRNDVSNDGQRVIFSSNQHLYVRDTATEETVLIDSTIGEASTGTAEYQGASADGKRVFFFDYEPLTPNSKAQSGRPDLFEWEQTSEPGKPIAGTLHDLTAPEGEGGNAQGAVPSISEDGATVYFVADAALAANANAEGEKAAPGDCRNVSKEPLYSCNLYVDKLEGGAWHPTFIARLSALDAPDWGNGEKATHLRETASGASPSGQYFAFESKRPLIKSYDNQVTTPAGEGARAEEVYLYDTATAGLTCASCEPSGERPTGIPDIGESSEGLGLLADRGRLWRDFTEEGSPVWMAGSLTGWASAGGVTEQPLFRPRYISDQGRLFFNSPEALVPADENGKEDVYQYEPDGVGSCSFEGGCVSLVSSGTSDHESAFLDASVSGNDVFFLTAASLVPEDRNGIYDVYDARVCTTSSPCVQPKAAQAEECSSRPSCDETPATSAPAVSSAPTTATGASGNVSTPAAPTHSVLPSIAVKPKAKPTRAQLLAKALKACKKLKQKHRRQACERVARRKYSAKASRR